ncbi:thioredoxin [Candidatus Saccharibacteria bacterium]|jgi:thioredoxin 1|nr:thioredoxin [Candidatus Saccharibacteria bacterium]MBP9132243.1 thioredoxin [Candidatus Saccharibacteria bacterium]
MPQVLTDAEFDEKVNKSQGLVFVDFWATWCPPCRAIAPILEDIDKNNDDVTVLKLDVDANPASSQAHQIVSIPTIKLFKDGKEVESIIGVQPKHVYQDLINQHS